MKRINRKSPPSPFWIKIHRYDSPKALWLQIPWNFTVTLHSSGLREGQWWRIKRLENWSEFCSLLFRICETPLKTQFFSKCVLCIHLETRRRLHTQSTLTITNSRFPQQHNKSNTQILIKTLLNYLDWMSTFTHWAI